MNTEFMTADTNLPPCLPLPGAMLGLPVSSTAKVMYARLLGRFIRRGRRTSTEFYLFNFPLWNWRRRWGAARRLASEPCGNWRTPDCSYGCAGRLERRTGFMSSFQEAKPLKNRRISRPKPFYKRSQVCYNKHMKLSV